MPGRASVTVLIRSNLHCLSFPKESRTSFVYFLTCASTELHRIICLAILYQIRCTVPGRTRLRSATAALLVVPYVPSKTAGLNGSFPCVLPWLGINCTNCLLVYVTWLCHWQLSESTLKLLCYFVNNDVLLKSARWQCLLFQELIVWHSLHSPLWCWHEMACNKQGCGLGLDVSVSRRSRDLSKVSSRSRLGHVGKRLGLVSVSGAKVSVLASVSVSTV